MTLVLCLALAAFEVVDFQFHKDSWLFDRRLHTFGITTCLEEESELVRTFSNSSSAPISASVGLGNDLWNPSVNVSKSGLQQ